MMKWWFLCLCGIVLRGIVHLVDLLNLMMNIRENALRDLCLCWQRIKASRPSIPVSQPQPIRSNVGQEIRPKARGFQLSLEKYNGKPKSDLTTWIAQVEEKCALQNISNEEICKMG